MNVFKFGGTSVGSAARMQQVADIISGGEPKVVVLSAVSGTTDKLVAIAEHLQAGRIDEANTVGRRMTDEYHGFIDQLYTKENTKQEARELFSALFRNISDLTVRKFTEHDTNLVLAQGELISTGLFGLYLRESGIVTVLLPALDFMRVNDGGEPDVSFIQSALKARMAELGHAHIYLTQGYICRDVDGRVSNLRRGGSDYSASLIGAALGADSIQIWTDIDGLHNNDPRVVDRTYPIRQLSFNEAAELAYFGAKILHPSSILPARTAGIPVLLKNTLDPQAEGTRIDQNCSPESLKAVAAKDGITAIKIRSTRMLLAHGFLRKVFEVFERYRTSIDMITTSEVAISLTIDDTVHLDAILTELKEFGEVAVDHDQTIVCIVGDLLAETTGSGARVFTALHDIPVRMISYGGSVNNVSVLVAREHKQAALQALNDRLFFREEPTAALAYA